MAFPIEAPVAHQVDEIWHGPDGSILGIVHGPLPNKSNRRQLVRGRVIKSKEAIEFDQKIIGLAKDLGLQQLVGATSKDDVRKRIPFLELRVVVYGENFARDLDCELLPDCLQHAGLINNDRAIREKHYWWALDQGDPRIEFEVRYLGKGAVIR